jgi:hypothetical protein
MKDMCGRCMRNKSRGSEADSGTDEAICDDFY